MINQSIIIKSKHWPRRFAKIKKIIDTILNNKNVVFMMNVDIGGSGRYASSRSESYKYSVASWKKWCEKNDCELFVLNDLLLPNDEMGIC